MKKILAIIIVLLAFAGFAQAQQAIITATITITNDIDGTTNGSAITVNGIQRYFTNIVTSSQTQIQRGTNILTTRTNLFFSYIVVRPPTLNIFQHSSNIVQIQSFAGAPLTVSISPNWATLNISTTYNTNMTTFRGYAQWVGAYERTSTANGIVSYLNDMSVTNPIATNSPAMVNFVTTNAFAVTSNGLRSIIYKVGLDSTNLSYMLVHDLTNDVMTASNNLQTEIVANLADLTATIYNIADAGTNNVMTASNNIITELITLGLAYRVGNDIKLTTTDTTLRMEAIQGGIWEAYFEDGISFPFLEADTSHNVIAFDHAGTQRYQQNDPAVNNGNTVLRTGSGSDTITLHGLYDQTTFFKPMSFNIQPNASAWAATVVGTVTNLLAAAGNSGVGNTTVNEFNVPANTLTNNGDSLIRTIAVRFAASVGNKQAQVLFSGTPILDTGVIANTGSGAISMTVEITRTSSDHITYRTEAIWTGTASSVKAAADSIGGLDFTSDINFYVILVAGAGSSSSDFSVIQDNTRLAPSPAWGGLQ